MESTDGLNERLAEIRKKMKGVKRVVVKITYDLKTGEMTVQHSPKKRFDPNLVLGMLVTSMQWLSADWYKNGVLEVPKIEDKGEKYIS